MKRRWSVIGIGCGTAIGVAMGVALSATLGAFDVPEKERRVRDRATEVTAAAQTGAATTDTKFVEIDPARVYDSRVAAYPNSGLYPRNTSRIIVVKDGHNSAGVITRPNVVPPGATAIAYNVTITGPTGPNFVAVTAGDATEFTASAINFNGAADVANAGIVSIDAQRRIRIWNGNQAGSTHVIVDITGYYVKPLFASVRADGTLITGSRVVSVGAVPPGEYDVTFDRDVTGCSYTATIGEPGSEPAGVIDVSRFRGNNVVTVFTQRNDGTPPPFEDRAFYLTVTC